MSPWLFTTILAFSLSEVSSEVNSEISSEASSEISSEISSEVNVDPQLVDPQLVKLVETLERSGFSVLWEQPPQWGSYGLLDLKERSIWIHPVVFDLEIAPPTIVHEAVHAAQWCAAEKLGTLNPQSIEDLTPLGLGITPSPFVRPYILRYTNSKRRQLELEAYALQAEENSIEQAIVLLETYCE